MDKIQADLRKSILSAIEYSNQLIGKNETERQLIDELKAALDNADFLLFQIESIGDKK